MRCHCLPPRLFRVSRCCLSLSFKLGEALAFRSRIWNAREAGERLTPYEQLAYLIIAWNAFKEDRTLKLVKFPNGKLTVKTFPDVK